MTTPFQSDSMIGPNTTSGSSSAGEVADEVGSLACDCRAHERDAGSLYCVTLAWPMPDEQVRLIGEECRNSVVRGNDAPGLAEEIGFALDQGGLGPEIRNCGGTAKPCSGIVQQAMDFGQRITAHNHIEGPAAEGTDVVEPRKPALGDDKVAATIIDRLGQFHSDCAVMDKVGALPNPARRSRDAAH